MLFHEIYGIYYNTVAKILTEAIKGRLDGEKMEQLVRENAYSESILTILPALEKQEWQLITNDYKTPLTVIPTMPLTVLQKRWMKSISLDARIRLFDAQFEGLENVEPLFTPKDYRIFDQYNDGDPYEDEKYIQNFRIITEALRTNRPLQIQYVRRKGGQCQLNCMPVKLEYSEKDDKFRLYTAGCRYGTIVNLSGIQSCKMIENWKCRCMDIPRRKKDYFMLEVTDERNALERVMLHFAHFEKQAEKIGTDRYRLTIYYDCEDETELVIRVLSFGTMVKAVEPEYFKNLIRERLIKQRSCNIR